MTSAESFLPHFRNCDRRVSAVRPEADEARKVAVTQAAQAVLDARARYAESTLADLYDPLTMPRTRLTPASSVANERGLDTNDTEPDVMINGNTIPYLELGSE